MAPALLLALAIAPAAAAHVTAVPPLVELGVARTIELDVPNERRQAPMTGLDVAAPPGVELTAEPTGSWRPSGSGATTSWRGARLAAGRVARFPVRVLARGAPRAVELVAVQRFADGASARWQVPLTLAPAGGADTPDQHLGRALVVLVAGVTVIAGSLVALHRTRRR